MFLLCKLLGRDNLANSVFDSRLGTYYRIAALINYL